MLLQQASKKDKLWREYATKLTKCRQKADDIVNDMYLKLHKSEKKQVKDAYIRVTIFRLYLNQALKESKSIYIDECIKAFRNKRSSQHEESTNKMHLRSQINQALNELPEFDRLLLLKTSETSLQKTADWFQNFSGEKISKVWVHQLKKEALAKLKETETIKKMKI